MKVKKVNAFTEKLHGGNPAGVAINSPKLTEKQMKNITKTLAVSETAFVFPSRVADYKVRFFSPTMEVDLCGHATIATFFTLAYEKIIHGIHETKSVDQETKAGILPIDITFKDTTVDTVMMTQQHPHLKGIHLNKKNLSQCLNIEESSIDTTLPEQKVSTGLFTLPVCVKSYSILENMRPNFPEIKALCQKIGVGSIHVFTFETLEENSTYHARNFPPLYGINEDPVTGTANGAVCSYLYKNKIIDTNTFICEQGDIMGRSGRVYVEIDHNHVKVGGKAKIVEEREIMIP